MFYTYNDKRTDQERYLESELQDMREREERRLEREEQERKQRQQEWKERIYEAERTADSWTEALSKQARLCWREHNQYPEDENDMDNYFKYLAEANEKALEIWNEVSKEKRAQLDELQKQIDSIWDTLREEVADKLIASSDRPEYKQTAEAIRDDALDGYLDW